jgi:hypothetical protein
MVYIYKHIPDSKYIIRVCWICTFVGCIYICGFSLRNYSF